MKNKTILPEVFITKYALTTGIRLVENVEYDSEFPRMISFIGKHLREHFHRPYWHTTLEDALDHVEQMRIKKIKSMQKQIAKLENYEVKMLEG